MEHLNPGQAPVVTFDQPLFVLAKQIQWKWQESYGEDKLVLGGDVWWAPHRGGCPKDAGGQVACEWLGACTGASRDYDARDCTFCNTVPMTATV